MKYIHNDQDWGNLINIVSEKTKILPALVEKDYWIMHALYGLKKSGYEFYLKGGTTLSKAFSLIERFSEDIDILIEPKELLSNNARTDTKKEINIQKRKYFFESLTRDIKIAGFTKIVRDYTFDDDKYRNAGVRLEYNALNEDGGIKHGILLEAGFDNIEPNTPHTISSWIYDHLVESNLQNQFIENRAVEIPCYHPGYTFIEKLQAVSTKFRQLKEGNDVVNFARHYYDISCLLSSSEVQDFIGTEKYILHKDQRFRKDDEKDLTKNIAFNITETKTFQNMNKMFKATESLYYGNAPSFQEILSKIKPHLKNL